VNECGQYELGYSRRDFLTRGSLGLGALSLANLLGAKTGLASDNASGSRGVLEGTHFPAKAKRVIYLMQSGDPS